MALKNKAGEKVINLFLKSRRDGVSPNTIIFYKKPLSRAIPILGLKPTPSELNSFLISLACSLGGKHAYFRVLRAFYRWLYSPKSEFSLNGQSNPMTWVDAPKVPRLILPSLTAEQVMRIIDNTSSIRDKAIIALFTESGLRLSEVSNINRVILTGRIGLYEFWARVEKKLMHRLVRYRRSILKNGLPSINQQ
jgi:site-specific recombinase XerD